MTYHRITKLFPPVLRYSRNHQSLFTGSSNAHKLMLENNIIYPAGNSMYNIMPIGKRSLNKLTELVHESMKNLQAQEISLPSLININLLKKSGKLDKNLKSLHMVSCTDDELLLAPTYEEHICDLFSEFLFTSTAFPLRLYQISNKYRRETATRGLIRTREFIMKDMYSFDVDEASAINTYEEISESYLDIFKKLELPVHRLKAPVGNIGGEFSHEFILLNEIGEANILKCNSCDAMFFEDCNEHNLSCNSTVFNNISGIELAHTFFLSTHYSEIFNSKYVETNINKSHFMQMGCYGMGITRLLAACLEHLSSTENIMWPTAIAPYKVCIISAKSGSKEAIANNLCNYILNEIPKISGYKDEILFNDKDHLSIGNRLCVSKRLGIPVIIICGKSLVEKTPKYEVIHTKNREHFFFTEVELFQYLSNLENNVQN